jgi:hypothetical protein
MDVGRILDLPVTIILDPKPKIHADRILRVLGAVLEAPMLTGSNVDTSRTCVAVARLRRFLSLPSRGVGTRAAASSSTSSDTSDKSEIESGTSAARAQKRTTARPRVPKAPSHLLTRTTPVPAVLSLLCSSGPAA